MKKIHKAVIIAAGMGTRIKEKTSDIPKTLLPFGKGTILSCIMENLHHAGIDTIIIIVGYNAEYIMEYIHQNEFPGLTISIVHNKEYRRGNGLSVYAARQETGDDDFLLSMSDHIVSTSAIKHIVESPLGTNLLLVDPDIDGVFDIDDATKVSVEDGIIKNIGKEISDYNAIDCGIFKFTKRYFPAMENSLLTHEESISSAVNILITNDDMRAVFCQNGDYWHDIDTPEAYQHALKHIVTQN